MARWLVLVLLAPSIAAADASVSATAPAKGGPGWLARCQQRAVALRPSLKAIGPVDIVARRPSSSGPFADRGRFGELTLLVHAGGATLRASVGDDFSGTRYRGLRGIEEKRYGDWHSPYLDSRDGDPPARAWAEEKHHRLAVNVLWARIEAPEPSPRFVELVRPLLEACLADVTPEESDPTLGWTTQCLRGLEAATAAVKQRPAFAGELTCERAPYQVDCGHLARDGQPRWNATLVLSGRPNEAARWTREGELRWSYRGDVLLWAEGVAAADGEALFAALRAPLERCSRVLRSARAATRGDDAR